MSNIANQVVAVVATLLGFVAHDLLSDRNAAPAVVASAASPAAIDPVVTRSIDLDGVSLGDWLAVSLRADARHPPAPAMRLSGRAAPARPNPDHGKTEFADIRVNDVRSAAPRQQNDTAFLR